MSDDNLKRTGEAIALWKSELEAKTRLKMYRNLCREAELQYELGAIPDLHIELMDYDRYAMNIVALKKLIFLRAIADYRSA